MIWLALLATVSLAQETIRAVDGWAELDRSWAAYLKKFEGISLQENCRPRRFPVDRARRKGAVFAVHGFTACPQQFFEWAKMLNDRGYEVFTFLMAGHGRTPPTDTSDDYSGLPDGRDWELYVKDAQAINDVAFWSPGVRVLTGLSVGATVALEASILAPHEYDRQLIFVPFFEIGPEVPRLLAERFKDSSSTKKIFWGWNTEPPWSQQPGGCQQERDRKPGRAGICEFFSRNLYGADRFGHHVFNSLGPAEIPTQFVDVESDPAVSNKMVKRGFAKIQSFNTKTSICFFPKGTNHSILSRFDSPDEKDRFGVIKGWIPAALAQATEFVVNGTFFKPAGMSWREMGYQQCHDR
jgi:pimeloyl-ACP methyl ester carboxylesterase